MAADGHPGGQADTHDQGEGGPLVAPPQDKYPPAVYIAGGIVVVLAIAIVIVLALGYDPGDDDGPEAQPASGTETTEPSSDGTVGSSGSTSEPEPSQPGTGDGIETPAEDDRAAPDLPPPDMSVEGSPPTTVPGTEPAQWEGLPLNGEISVDVESGGYADRAVHLRGGRLATAAIAFTGPEGMTAEVELFAPSGASLGYQPVEPGVSTIMEVELPSTGTYVLRVIHADGAPALLTLRIFS